MSDQETLLHRIRKLLTMTMAAGATEAEAATALAMAQRLMDEHNIRSADIPESEAESFERRTAWEGPRMSSHISKTSLVIEEMFAVKVVIQEDRPYGYLVKAKLLVFGDPANTENAVWAIGFLSPLYRHLWTIYRLRTGAPSSENVAYYSGLTSGLIGKLRRDREARETRRETEAKESTSHALERLQTRLDRAYKAEFPDIKTMKNWSVYGKDSFGEGQTEGRNINIARPLDRERKTKQLEGGRP